MITHIPRGQMCMTCICLYHNCSQLKFKEMRIIEKDVELDNENYQIVKCNNHIKR